MGRHHRLRGAGEGEWTGTALSERRVLLPLPAERLGTANGGGVNGGGGAAQRGEGEPLVHSDSVTVRGARSPPPRSPRTSRVVWEAEALQRTARGGRRSPRKWSTMRHEQVGNKRTEIKQRLGAAASGRGGPMDSDAGGMMDGMEATAGIDRGESMLIVRGMYNGGGGIPREEATRQAADPARRIRICQVVITRGLLRKGQAQ